MANKNIRFDYFQVKCKALNERGELYFPLYDLEPLLNKALSLSPQERTFSHADENSRMQELKNIEEKISSEISRKNKTGAYSLWVMMFLRIRKDYIPGIATDEGKYDPLDKFADEDISILLRVIKIVVRRVNGWFMIMIFFSSLTYIFNIWSILFCLLNLYVLQFHESANSNFYELIVV